MEGSHGTPTGRVPESTTARLLSAHVAPLFAHQTIAFGIATLVPLLLSAYEGVAAGVLAVLLIELLRAFVEREAEWRAYVAAEMADATSVGHSGEKHRGRSPPKTPGGLRQAVRTQSGTSYGFFKLDPDSPRFAKPQSPSPPRKRARRLSAGFGLGIDGLATPPETPDVRRPSHMDLESNRRGDPVSAHDDNPPPPYDPSDSSLNVGSHASEPASLHSSSTSTPTKRTASFGRRNAPVLTTLDTTSLTPLPMVFSAVSEPSLQSLVPGAFSPTFLPSPSPSLPATNTRLLRENGHLRKLLTKARAEIVSLEDALLQKGLELGRRVLFEQENNRKASPAAEERAKPVTTGETDFQIADVDFDLGP
ncbi:hypothetical protein DFJ74DRAFT_201296 [Hyaloraphidium curvatum]|nr:hypothetical protein DFJ74DRAFT_201296 [Hyaloraphidium curvatum]